MSRNVAGDWDPTEPASRLEEFGEDFGDESGRSNSILIDVPLMMVDDGCDD